jgi:hypothetical protein
MSVIDHHLIRFSPTKIPEQRFDPDGNGNYIYQGWSWEQNTLTSTSSWMIAKLTYNGSNQLIRIQVKSNVIWDNRAALSW